MKVVMIHLDGLGYNYLKKSDLSYIKSLGGYLHRMSVYPGYFPNEVSLFTGLTPEQHKMEDLFVFDPASSPFKSNLSLLIPKKLFRLASYFYDYETYININPPKRHFQKFVPVSKIPPRDFDDSFPSLLIEKGLKFEYINSLHFNTDIIKKAIRDNDCVYAMDSTYDTLLHKHGTEKIIKTDIDNTIKKIHKFLLKKYNDDFYLILLSDHGMIPVHTKIKLDLNDKDNLFFVDSTILRVWSNKNYQLNSTGAELYDSKEFSNGPFKYYKKFLAEPGYLFSPNFFQGHKNIMGMHGYKSTNSPHDAFALIHTPKYKKQHNANASIIDIAPTILKIFNMKSPTEMGGRSLL